METQKLSERESKALAIATHTQLVRNPNNTWIVPSQSSTKTYTVNLILNHCSATAPTLNTGERDANTSSQLRSC